METRSSTPQRLDIEALMAGIRKLAELSLMSPNAGSDEALKVQADFKQGLLTCLTQLAEAVADLSARAASAEQVVEQLGEELAQARRETQLAQTRATDALALLAFSAEDPFNYFRFEQRFRGPIEEIKRRQEIYLDFYGKRRQVLDIGCGRGEFVELLRGRGIDAHGIDSNENMVAFCRERGLPVQRADMFDHLTSMPRQSVDGIFLAQVVEHLPPPLILRLLRLCAGVLAPGGVVTAETVNTNGLGVLSNFYLDPTHVRPVPAELLRFLFEQAGLAVDRLRYSTPLPGRGVPDILDVFGSPPEQSQYYQDYAVIGVGDGNCGAGG